MQKASRPFDTYQLAIGLTILAGVLLRLGHLLFIDHGAPFRLGGLFLAFSEQILKENFALPATIPYYSSNGLPFAYPPLPFYVQALVLRVFHPHGFASVNFLPPLAAALSVPSFYYLVRQIASSRLEAWGMLAAFAFIPNTFLDPIEAGGLSEAFGALAIIWYAAFLVRAYKNPGWAATLLAGLFLGICILSSPGSAVAAPVLSLVYVFLLGLRAVRERRLDPLYAPAAIALIGLLVSAPYWLTVALRHGPGIFLGSVLGQFQTGQRTSFLQQSLERLLTLNLSSIRNNSFLWSALTFLGMLSSLAGPGAYLAVLFILFSLLPREGIWLSAIIASLLAGKGLVLAAETLRPARLSYRWVGALLLAVFIIVGISTAVLSIESILRDRQAALPAEQAAALEKHAALIPPDAKVIGIGNDGFMEWAPQLLKREVVNTPFGLEWQPPELNAVNRLNKDLEDASTIDAMMLAVERRFHLKDFYLVTNVLDRFSDIPRDPTSAGTVTLLSDDGGVQIYHLVIP